MKLYYSPNLNPRVAVAVAKHLKSPVQYIRARPFHPAHMEAFRKINPNTRVPVLVEDGPHPVGDGRHRLPALGDRRLRLLACGRRAAGDDHVDQLGHPPPDPGGGPVYFDRVVRPKFSDKVMDQARSENP